MAFLADLYMVIFMVGYLKLNKRLYKWRLGVTEKYPWISSRDKSFKAEMRGIWEFAVSILLICGLYVSFIFVCIVPSKVAHTSAQLTIVPIVVYWGYTFVSVTTYPRSHQLARWLGKQGKKLLNRPSV